MAPKPHKIKPKAPKPRKKKTAKQLSDIAKRQKAEASNTFTAQQVRKANLLKAYAGYSSKAPVEKSVDTLTGAMGGMGLDTAPTKGFHELSWAPNPISDAPDEPGGARTFKPTLVPGVRYNMRNPTSEVRRHNRQVKLSQNPYTQETGTFTGPITDVGYSDQHTAVKPYAHRLAVKKEREVDFTSRTAGLTGLGDLPPGTSPFSSVADLRAELEADMMPDEGVGGILALQEVRQFEGTPGYSFDRLGFNEESQIGVQGVKIIQDGMGDSMAIDVPVDYKNMPDDRPIKEVVEIGMEPEDVLAFKKEGMELTIGKKKAKTKEERDYYVRKIKDLKERGNPATRGRAEKRELAASQGQYTTMGSAQLDSGRRVYPGPANIQGGILKVSMETSVRPNEAYEEHDGGQFLGGGIAGQDGTPIGGYQRFAKRKSQKLSGIRDEGFDDDGYAPQNTGLTRAMVDAEDKVESTLKGRIETTGDEGGKSIVEQRVVGGGSSSTYERDVAGVPNEAGFEYGEDLPTDADFDKREFDYQLPQRLGESQVNLLRGKVADKSGTFSGAEMLDVLDDMAIAPDLSEMMADLGMMEDQTFASSGNKVPLQMKKHRAYSYGFNAMTDGHYPKRPGDNAPSLKDYAY